MELMTMVVLDNAYRNLVPMNIHKVGSLLTVIT